MKKNFVIICFLLFSSKALLSQDTTKEKIKDSVNTKEYETEEITVSTTRTSGRIEDTPTRIEVLGEDDIKEKQSMVPSNIGHLLNETPGVQTQQTSTVTGSQSFKLQGLDGKYTQILKDGFPLYSGLISGLSLIQIPPLDLKQVELIKGPTSTLYGGDAIAGVINLISKEPENKNQLSGIFNLTSYKGYDINAFYSGINKKIGYTVLATRQYQKAKDVDNDGFSDIPKIEGFILNPKLYIYFDPKTTAWISLLTSRNERNGGYIFLNDSIKNPYTEKLTTSQNYSQIYFEKSFKNNNKLTFKNSINYFSKALSSLYNFSGSQWNTYSELSYLVKHKKITTVFGVNFNTEKFNEDSMVSGLKRDYYYKTLGTFIQSDFDFTKKITLEAGLRTDYQNKYKLFVLPRLTAKFEVTDNFIFRIGGGIGYKIPAVFTDETESPSKSNVLPLNDNLKAEVSYGGNFDFNYRTLLFKKLFFSLNQAYYFTYLKNPLVLNQLPSNFFEYVNSNGYILSHGLETNIRLAIEKFNLYFGYTYINAYKKFDNVKYNVELVPKHKFAITAIYEIKDFGRIGIEGFYTGKQYLSDGTQSNPFWVMGATLEKEFNNFNLFLNFENLTNVKQSNFSHVVLPPYQNPVFKDIWAPLEGILINGGVKIKF